MAVLSVLKSVSSNSGSRLTGTTTAVSISIYKSGMELSFLLLCVCVEWFARRPAARRHVYIPAAGVPWLRCQCCIHCVGTVVFFGRYKEAVLIPTGTSSGGAASCFISTNGQCRGAGLATDKHRNTNIAVLALRNRHGCCCSCAASFGRRSITWRAGIYTRKRYGT